MRLLVTGFEPFGGETINPSWEVAQRLPNLLDAEVHAALLPVHAQRVRAALDEAIARARPDLLLSLGQAGRRFEVTPERIAINLVAYRDEAGEPREEPIEPDGPAAYFTTLDLKRMVAAMREAGVPAQISNSAGAYIC
ncbi:MAG TPA: pyroglutamyl-peptidase I, partial [Dehalococcoidia bacterium]|nr:pyroglutamyl-peptidase I [Dehalococcoidia bacterium]